MFHSVDEMSRIAAELKQAAKQIAGSTYKIDRRSEEAVANPLTDRRGTNAPEALIICQNDIARGTIVGTLNSRGYRLLIADNDIAAQGLLAHHPHPALLVAEFNPDIIRLWQELNQTTPLIALVRDETNASAARDAGANTVVWVDDNPVELSDQLQLALAALAK
jgi:CheY-like chemotaxis protein